MENLETKAKEMVKNPTKRSKNAFVGALIATALGATIAAIWHKIKKNKVEEPQTAEEVFDGINEEI